MSRKQSPSMLLLDQHRQEIEELLNNKASVALLVRKFGTSANTMKKYKCCLQQAKEERVKDDRSEN